MMAAQMPVMHGSIWAQLRHPHDARAQINMVTVPRSGEARQVQAQANAERRWLFFTPRLLDAWAVKRTCTWALLRERPSALPAAIDKKTVPPPSFCLQAFSRVVSSTVSVICAVLLS